MFKFAAALVAAALLAAISGPAHAGFAQRFLVSSQNVVEPLPQVAIGANGDVAFAWIAADATHWRVQARARSAAGVLGPVTTLLRSEAGRPIDQQPQVAVDADGDILVVWRRVEGAYWRAEARGLSAAGVLGPLQTVSPPGRDASALRVVTAAGGNAVITWQSDDGDFDNYQVQARTRSTAGVLGPLFTLSAIARSDPLPQVGMDADGNALVAWLQYGGSGSTYLIQARSISAAAVAGPLRTVFTSALDRSTRPPEVAVDADGDAVVMWVRFNGTDSRVQSRTLSAAGALGPVLTIAPVGAQNPRIASDAEGDAVVTWHRHDGANFRVQMRTLSKAGVLGPIRTLSPAGLNGTFPEVAADADGDAAFVYWDSSNYRIHARTRSSAGVLGAVQILSQAGQFASDPRVVMNADGDAAATWEQASGGLWRVLGAETP